MLKKVLLFLLLMGSTMAFAREQAGFLELGSVAGSSTFTTSDPTTSFLNGTLDHKLAGSSFSLGVMEIEENGLIWGGGYHSYQVTGESALSSRSNVVSGTPVDWQVKLRTTNFSVDGFYGMLGYRWKFAPHWAAQPNLRIGLQNSFKYENSLYLKATVSGSSSASESPYRASAKGNTLIVSLPLLYRLKTVSFGVQFQSIGATYSELSATSTFKAQLASASQLVFMSNF